MKQNFSCSIVLYKNDRAQITRAIESVQSYLPSEIYLIDNSPTDDLAVLAEKFNCHYIHKQDNVGFGAAHNIAIMKSLKSKNQYHLILNPDIYFDEEVLPTLINYLDNNLHVGFVMPKILYPDKSVQYLCKLLPTPADLILRRFFPTIYNRLGLLQRYELRDSGYDRIMKVPYLSGCFMLVRCDVLSRIGGFDENFFMYLEDVDLSRRIGQVADTMFFPKVSVFHEYGKGSYNNFKLLSYHIRSAIYYFFKWGWFFDSGRSKINKSTLMDVDKHKSEKTNPEGNE